MTIPEDKYTEVSQLVNYTEGGIDFEFPYIEGVKPTTTDGFQKYLN